MLCNDRFSFCSLAATISIFPIHFQHKCFYFYFSKTTNVGRKITFFLSLQRKSFTSKLTTNILVDYRTRKKGVLAKKEIILLTLPLVIEKTEDRFYCKDEFY